MNKFKIHEGIPTITAGRLPHAKAYPYGLNWTGHTLPGHGSCLPGHVLPMFGHLEIKLWLHEVESAGVRIHAFLLSLDIYELKLACFPELSWHLLQIDTNKHIIFVEKVWLTKKACFIKVSYFWYYLPITLH